MLLAQLQKNILKVEKYYRIYYERWQNNQQYDNSEK